MQAFWGAMPSLSPPSWFHLSSSSSSASLQSSQPKLSEFSVQAPVHLAAIFMVTFRNWPTFNSSLYKITNMRDYLSKRIIPFQKKIIPFIYSLIQKNLKPYALNCNESLVKKIILYCYIGILIIPPLEVCFNFWKKKKKKDYIKKKKKNLLRGIFIRGILIEKHFGSACCEFWKQYHWLSLLHMKFPIWLVRTQRFRPIDCQFWDLNICKIWTP